MIRKALVKRGGQIVEVTIDDSTYKDGGSHGGLDRWFAEEWVDIKTGKPCGRQKGENRKGYPACRPSKRVSSETPKTASELSSSEKAKFKRAKQSSSKIPYQHKRRQKGGEENSTFENFLEFIDPTGILSWDDANKAYNDWKNSNSTLPSMDQSLDMFGAVPGLGKLGKLKYLNPNSIKKAYNYIPWQKILNAFDTAEDERVKIEKRIKKQRGGESDDKQMVDGIADILSQVEDMNNRKQIAKNMLADFRNEDVSFNYQDFLNNSGIPELKSGGNKPTNPALWSRAKALARSKFDVYPSAYANGWAAKWYKGKGGGWRKAQEGGQEDFYTPDTGIEQFAPDQSWYEGNPNASVPGNIVSWPSYPRNSRLPISELPVGREPKRVPPSLGSIYLRTGKYASRPSNSMMFFDTNYGNYQDYIPEYGNRFGLFNRIGQDFNDMGDRIDGRFDDLSEFFKKIIEGVKKLRIGRRRGKGISNCAPGTNCEDFKQEGGEGSNQMEELLDQIEDALEQGIQPEEILLQLTEMGIDEEQAQMLIQAAENELPEAANGIQTPFINNGGDDDEIQKKLAKVKRPEDLFASDLNKANEFRQESEKYFTDWISDPVTKERLKKSYHQEIDFIDRAVGDIKGQTTKEVRENLKDKYINDIVSQSIKNLSKGNILHNPDPTINKFLEEKYYSLLPEEDRKRAIKNAQKNPQGFTDSYGNVVITNAANDPNIGPYAGQGAINVYLHELGHLPLFGDGESYGEFLKGKFKASEDPELAKNFNYKDREEFWPALMQYREANKLVPGQIVSPEDVKRFIGSGGRNLLFKYYTPEEVAKYLNTVAYNKQDNSMGLDIPTAKDGGSYRVYRTSERKGKTHKVVGPGGVTKYFGDPKLGERSKSKYGKKAFYARHKKNLANNPFFRAYARATWAEGGEPTFMNKPEFKSSSFIEKVKQLGQQNLEKNLFEQFEEEQNQMMMAAGGYMDDPSYIKNPQIDMFNQARQKLGNPIGNALKAFNDWGLKTEKKIEQAATALGMAFGVPGAGKMVKAGFDMARPKTGNENQTASAGTSGSGGMGNMLNSIMGSAGGSGGAGAAGATGGMDISQLASLFGARYGGSLRKFQSNVFGSQVDDTGFPDEIEGSFMDPNAPVGGGAFPDLSWWDSSQNNTSNPPINMEAAGIKGGRGSGTFPNSLPTRPPVDLGSFTGQTVTTGLPLGISLLKTMAEERKFDKYNAQSSNLTLADNSFLATEQPNRGDYTLNEGFFRPDEQGMPGANYAIPRLSAARYGGNLRRAQDGLENVISFTGDRYVENYLPAGNNQKPLTNEYFRNINYYSDMPSDTTYGYVSAPGGNQYIINSRLTPQSERDLSKEEMIKRKLKVKKHGGVQKDGMYLSYPTATPESVVYGEQPRKISNTLSPIKREFANLEAEGGETVITPAGIDGLPKFFKIRGKRHSEGGAPLYLPDNSFIFSDTRSMKFSKDILEEFGIKGKNKKTPAQISGILGNGYDQYIKIIQDPNSDSIERKTAEMMIRNQIILLGKLAVAQESKKGFPQGIPMIAIPYLESMGISPEELLPQIPNQQNNMGELGNQQQMPEMSMKQMPMARYGMQKYQTGREKQTNPLITSGPSTPDNPNIAQRILGPLFNLAAGLPEETNIPIKTFVSPYTKGLGDYEQEEEFIQKATDLGDQDFKPLVDEYKGRLDALDILRAGLLSGNINQVEYNTEKDRILNEINALSPVLQKIDLPGSWEYWPGSTQNKISDMISILGEETKKLEDTETFVTKLNTKNQNIDELVREKSEIEKMLKEKGIGNLTKYQLGEDLKNITKAINSEIYEREKFSRNFTGADYYNQTVIDPINHSFIYSNENSRSPERYTYDDYMTYKNKNVSQAAASKADSTDITNIDLSMPTSVIDSSATKDSSGVNTPADSSRVVESAPVKQKQKQSSNRNQTVNKSKIRTKTKLKFATGATEE